MAVRPDVSVDWEADPRIITVASPSTEISIQDLVDTCRYLESRLVNIQFDRLLDASGKEPLGGAVFVGITVKLNNALLAFEARGGPSFVQCNVSGGNLTAVDEFGADIDPMQTTAYTQIVRTSSSSATLQELADIQFSSFSGGVWLDVAGGTSGTTFPIGTERQPSSNLTDALTISEDRGFGTIFVLGNLTVTNEDIEDFTFIGESLSSTTITIEAAALTEGSAWERATITGEMDGDATFVNCILDDLSMVNGDIVTCGIKNTLTLTGTEAVRMLECYDAGTVAVEPTLDLGGAGPEVHILNYQGHLNIAGKTNTKTVRIGLGHGYIHVLASVTDGDITITGVGSFLDESTGSATVDGGNLIDGAQVNDLFSLQGLRVGAPMTVTPTARTVAAESLSQTISGDGITSTTVTRDP